MNISYVRVSHYTQHSTDGRQSETAFPVQIDKAYIDHGYSGANTDRPALKEMLGFVRANDHIWVYDISRLARSVKDFAEITEEVTSKGATLHFVSEGLSVGGSEDPCQKLFVQILSALAEWELSIQKQRRTEGIRKAMEQNRYKGVVGRKKSLSNERIEAIKARMERGESITKIAKSEHISRTTIYRYCK